MNGTTSLTFQQQLESLSLILEHWLPFLEEMELIEKNIEDLPNELESIRRCIQRYNQEQESNEEHGWLDSISVQQSSHKEKVLYFKLQHILASLDNEIPHLLFLEKKIKNLICLREVTEALQEDIRARSVPSNNRHNFDLSRASNSKSIKVTNQKPQGIWQLINSWWRNLTNPKRLTKKLKLILFFGLILGWNLLSNFIYAHVTDKNFDTQVNKIEHRLENVQIHNFTEMPEP